MALLELTPSLFAIWSSLIEERVGLCHAWEDRELFANKLALRMGEAGFDSLLDYYYFLRYDPSSQGELDALVNALVVNETFFFRELAPLEVVVSQCLRPIITSGRRARIWCAACSTGEEALTLAMLLDQQALLDQVEIVASDISSGVLERAQSGRHPRRSLRQPPPPQLAEKWLSIDEQGVAVDEALRRAIRWQRLNLLDEPAVLELGTFDLILCRNVLIYFRDTTARRVVDLLSRQLCPDGVLLVGVSESLLRFGSRLICEERAGAFLYRKPAT